MKLTRIATYVAIATTALTVSACSGSNSDSGAFPTENIEVVVPYDAGGETDVFSRYALDIMQKEGLIGEFRIVNRPGGSTAVGHKYVDGRAGENHMLLASASTLVTGSLLSSETPDFSSFTPIAQIGSSAGVWTVSPDSGITSIPDLIEASKQEGGVTVAIGALGTLDHAAMLKLADLTGGTFTPIPNDSAGQAVVQVLNGSADVAIASPSAIAGQVEAGELDMIATAAQAPILGLDVPRFADEGFDVEFATPKVFMAPAGISEEAKTYYIDGFRTLTESDAWTQYLTEQMISPAFFFGDEVTQSFEATQQELAPLFEEAGLGK